MSEANLIPLPLAIFGAAMNVVVVVVGIGFLIFVHELGHFLVAKWNKVRVEAFSLGFGPVIWGFWKGETHYRLSLVPLGGYVKMAGGDAPTASYESDDPGEFPNKSVPVRIAVYSAGVVMNAITGILFFVVAFNVGVPLVAPVAGVVTPGTPAWQAGIRPGDRLLDIGGREIIDFDDVLYAVAFGDGALDFEVERDGRRLTFGGVKPVQNEGVGFPMVGIGLPAEHTIEVRPGSPAERAGLEAGDKLLTVGRVDVRDPASHGLLVRELRSATGPVTVVVRRGGESGETLTFELTPDLVPATKDRLLVGIAPVFNKIVGVTSGSPAESAGFESEDVLSKVNGVAAFSLHHARELAAAVAPESVVFTVRRGEGEVVLPPVSEPTTAADWRRFFLDLYEGPAGSSATVSFDRTSRYEDGIPVQEAGLQEGATILTVGGVEVSSFDEIRSAISEVRDGEPVALTYRLHGESAVRGPVDVVRQSPMSPDYGLVFPYATETVRVPGLLASCGAGFRRSIDMARRIFFTLGGLFTGRVSAKNLGGPIAIFQISYSSARKNFIHFLYILGLLSINLAILNILPIPVLDGGHLMFAVIEAVRRKPLSEQSMAMFQWAGLLVIVVLMVFVIANDITRMIGM